MTTDPKPDLELAAVTPDFDATSLIGIPVRLFRSVVQDVDGSTSFPALDNLLSSVAVYRVMTPVQLLGPDIKYLRSTLGLTQTEFAETMCSANPDVFPGFNGLYSNAIISQWELDEKHPDDPQEEEIRRFVIGALGHRAPGIFSSQDHIHEMVVEPREPEDGPVTLGLYYDQELKYYCPVASTWQASDTGGPGP